MRLHRFINSLLYLAIQLVVKESKDKETMGGLGTIDKRFILLISTHN